MEHIKKGEAVYRHNPLLDLMLSASEFDILDPREKELILHYGYVDKRTGSYRLDHDDVRFVNDSVDPNIGYDEDTGQIVALRDIQTGEELLQNYRDFDDRRFAIH